MPIIGATEIQPANILGSYMSGLEMGRANRLAQQQARQAQQASLEDQELRNALAGGLDIATPEGQAQLFRFGAPGVALAEKGANIGASRALTGEREASTLKTQTERDIAIRNLANENYGRFQKALGDMAFSDSPLTKQDVLVNLQAMIQQGIVAPQMEQFAASTLPDNPDELRMALRDQFLTQIPPVERANLFVPMSPEVFEQQLALRRGGASRTTIEAPKPAPSETELEKEIGKTAAARLDKFRAGADSAVSSIQLASQLRPLLDSKDFISGTFADARLAIAKALGINVSQTEAYFAGVGRQVGELIKQFGAGTGLSDADREFAQKIAGGKETLSIDGIRKIMKINDKAARNVIATYNQERQFLGKDRPAVMSMYPEINIQREVLRTGTLNGRRVVEYSDGSIEYGD